MTEHMMEERTERLVILIACEKLNIEAATGWTIERDAARFIYRVAITGRPIVEVTDEEIVRRRPERRR